MGVQGQPAGQLSFAMIKLLYFVLLLIIPAAIHGWVELTTTFGSWNSQPRSLTEAQDAGWIKIQDATEGFAGVRYYPPMDVPDKVLIYDGKGQVVGLQSGAPESDFVSGNCTLNQFCVRDVIAGKQF